MALEPGESKQQLIADVMREEQNRGKRSPAALDAKKDGFGSVKEFEKILDRGTEKDLVAAVRARSCPSIPTSYRS